MAEEVTKLRAGIVGLSPAGLYLLERLSLTPGISVTGVFDPNLSRLAMATEYGCTHWKHAYSGTSSPEVDILFLMGDFSTELISTALENGKHVVIHEPWRLPSEIIRELGTMANLLKRSATISCFRRWTGDFLATLTATKSGRLGDVQSVRFSSCEQGLPLHDGSAGILREFGYHWLDQLLLLVNSSPTSVFGHRFFDKGLKPDHGVWATIKFANGCLAHVDLQSRSRLAHRTGWMIEGSIGSYKIDRLYTMTPDGEIVDEPLLRSPAPFDPFIDELFASWSGKTTTLPTLSEASRVIRLIEAIESSATSGEVVQI